MMKHSYSFSKSWLRWLCIGLLAALPGLGFAQTVTLTPNAGGDPQDFGSVVVNTSSASKSYKVTGSSLIRDVTVTIPTGFQGSIDNVNFSGNAITLPMSSGSVSATVYLKFSPTSIKSYSDDFFASSRNATTSYITVNGTGTAGPPTITINPAALGFGNQITNTQSSPMTVTVNATSLKAPVMVTAPTDFQVSTDNTTYSQQVSLDTVKGGAIVNATLYVVFRPMTAQPYVATVDLVSTGTTSANSASKSIQVSGTGVMPTPVLNVSPTMLPDYGSVVVGNSGTATNSFTVGGQNLQKSVTITPPAGFRIRTGTDVFSTNPIVLTVTNSTIPTTTIDVRFTPTTAKQYKDSVSVSTPNGSSATVAKYVKVSGTATPAPTGPTVVVNPNALNFGTVTSSGSANTLTFDVSGTNLTNDIVLTPSMNTIQFRNASAGGTFSSNPLTLMQTNGTVATQTIEVQLVATVPQGSYDEQIDAVSGNVSSPVSILANNSSGAISSISVSNPNSNDFTFATRPTTLSASQSFLVSGNNLLQNLTIAPDGKYAGYFQLSSDNVTFASSLTFMPNASGRVESQVVYVRFVPGDNTVTVTANIRSSSAPAPIFDVSVTGISQPTIRLSRMIPAFPTNVVKGTKSDPATVRLDGFLLGGDVAIRFPADVSDRNPAQTPQFEFSLDGGTTYASTGSVTPDPTTGNFSQSLQVRFAPVRVGYASTEMQFSNPSFSGGNFFVLASGFGQTSGFAIATEPTVQSTASISRAPGSPNADIVFNLSNPPVGKTYGQKRLVIASTMYSQLPTNLFPQDTKNFTADKTDSNGAYIFGTGSAIEASSNTYVVYSDASANFTITNLDPNTQYYFYAFEYNNDGTLNAENYLVPSNQPLSPLPVELVAFTARRSGKLVNLNWVTASEKNSRSFDVERSADGRQFTAILSKAAQGTSSARTSYDAVDRQPLPGLSYYRLKQIDIDGTVAYSPVVSVQGDGAVAIGIYPNPTAGKLTISLPQALADAAPRVSISDMMGRVVKEMALPANGEVDLSALPAGTYLVNVGGQQVHGRVVKF